MALYRQISDGFFLGLMEDPKESVRIKCSKAMRYGRSQDQRMHSYLDHCQSLSLAKARL